ncbi:hypothetical protein [Cellulosimicrobium sp. TH-20]|uniref:VG15 protein n=1 Tax=Cellulosimicrobium sp. TH-20 TaxID=1980001 RepID=UPI0011A0F1D3|nr:hypothetical protein [Cellulosimicrobium sp. TH-20]
MDEELALADAFRVGQARGALVMQRALSAAFERALDPYDVDGSFPRYLELATRLLVMGNAQSAQAALDYYREARIAAGLSPDVPGLTLASLNRDAVETSLRVTGPVTVKRLTGQGKSPAQAAALAQAATLRMTKRLVLNGGREALVEAARRDRDALGFARVSDGGPCAFCAMLVGRGPVYSGATVGFQAHDGCGCVPRPVFANDPARGWTPQARAMQRLYRAAQEGVHEDENGFPIYDFRTLLRLVREGKFDLAA